jgi:hypothetical protein
VGIKVEFLNFISDLNLNLVSQKGIICEYSNEKRFGFNPKSAVGGLWLPKVLKNMI